MPEILAVAFDMDGLMFNTEDLYDKVGKLLLEKRGYVYSNDLKLKMIGLPGSVAFEVMRSELGLSDSVEQLQHETDELFGDILPNEIATMPGLLELLDLLETKNKPKAVCTSSHRKFARKSLGYFDLEPRFEFVLTSEDVSLGKPNPEVYLTAAKRLNVKPENLLVLEDSVTGSTAGAASGAFTIAVPTSHSKSGDYSHVDLVVDSLEDEKILSLIR